MILVDVLLFLIMVFIKIDLFSDNEMDKLLVFNIVEVILNLIEISK